MTDIEAQGKQLLKKLSRARFFAHASKRLSPAQLDQQVHEAHETAFSEIDCLMCANCCKTLGPRIEHADITRMAKALRMPEKDLVSTFLRIDEDGDYVVNALPCPFLDLEDNYCSIYKDRPRACREYPHTDRRRQHQLLTLHKKNATTCPAVQRVLADLAQRVSK